jgi:hypothetical protein
MRSHFAAVKILLQAPLVAARASALARHASGAMERSTC